MAEIKHWLLFGSWLIIFNLCVPASPARLATPLAEDDSNQAQTITSLFKTASTLWQNYHQQTPLRHKLSLNGKWRASCTDPEFSGEVELPGAFLFEGQVTFQKSFRLDSTLRNRPMRLVIQGANYETSVEINGELTGRHEGGFMPFGIEIQAARLFFDKENLLTLTVNNELSPLQTLPAKHRPWGWPNDGGILREIYLEALPDIFIESTRIKYDFDALGVSLNLNAELHIGKKMAPEESAGITGILEIWDVDRLRKLATSAPEPFIGSNRFQQTLALKCHLKQPTLWSPATPFLYAMRVALVRQNDLIDEWWQEIGFRKIEFVNQQLRLNGQPLIVRGINWIEDYGQGTALLDTTHAIKLLAEAKNLGANVIRVIGHPPHAFLPAWCDRAGIFLLEEVPIYYLTDAHFRQPQFADMASLQARAMIHRDLAHPSVLGWGVGVNCGLLSSEAKNAMRHLYQELRQLDDRPIYAVTPVPWISTWEPLADFILPDLFEHEEIATYANALTRTNKPLFPIIGFWLRDERVIQGQTSRVLSGQSGDAEQWQAEKLDKLLKKFEDTPKFPGYFLQALTDWPASMPLLILGPGVKPLSAAAYMDTANTKAVFVHPAGIIGDTGRRRMVFQMTQAFNLGDRRPMLIPKNITPVHPQEYPIVGLGIILVFLFYVNRDRRLRGNLKRVFVHPHGFYVDLSENRKVPPFLSTLLGLLESCIVALVLSGFCYANRESMIFDQSMNLLLDDPVWKARAIWLIWHPAWFIAIGTAGLFVAGVLIAVLMRILGFFLGRSLPTIQYYTFIFWTATNLLLLGMPAPFFYRLLLYSNFTAPLLFVVILVFLWLAGRFFRGMRVIYTMSIPRTMIIFGILVGGLLISLALYYQRTEAIFEYTKYYWQLLMTQI
ncbi:MAG: hypothetical protein ONB44_13100 [candidate division KSB1 bacterium]|nr:hypothetical protein [candidate division KSB1 bacterium]MDZ7312434.1 hypothetical protein [candidate division KSB1 bacterium]